MQIADSLCSMYAAAHNPIDYPVVWASTLFKQPPAGQAIPAIKTFVGIPPDAYQQQVPGFAAQFNAVDTMVCMSSSPPCSLWWKQMTNGRRADAYSGALIFVAFMAEMRHPMDFWKGVLLAQAFICFVYLLFGLFVRSPRSSFLGNNLTLTNLIAIRSTRISASTQPPTSIRSSTPKSYER